MPKAPITIYDLDMHVTAYLQNAFNIGYSTPFNGLRTATFSLPADDPKNAECLPLHYVEVFDGNERVDLFRITPNSARRNASGKTVSYQCEHVIATLLDDVMFQFHTVGNLGVYTSDVIAYILSKQLTARWKLGTVEFTRQFEYTWENENLFAALLSVPKPFDAAYQWTYDTSSYPWTLNLVAPPEEVGMIVKYGVNLRGIERTVDPRDLCTRLYCLGYGEGVNQLTIADVNGGLPYLDADTQAQYGVINRIWVDRRYTRADTLKARGQALLKAISIPRVSYTVEAADLSAFTKDPMDKFVEGAPVRVMDEEMGIDIVARVVNVKKNDITGNPGDVEIVIANKPEDIISTIVDLANRQHINDVYAQGATNYDSHDFADNCDPDHPAVLKFWIPEDTARINKVSLSFEAGAFRAYSKAIEAAPATSSGASSAETTASAPAVTSGASSAVTTAGGGGYSGEELSLNIYHPTGEKTSDAMEDAGLHDHGIPNGTQLATSGGGSVTYSSAGDHKHSFLHHNHAVERVPHTHGMEHTHQIPAHTHEMPHTHQIPAHTHDIEYGIFEGPTPESVVVSVDGNAVPGLGTSGTDIDIVPYLAKDGEGKITRGTWHTIEITPDKLGRIVASVVSQIFVQSRGGGNY